MPFDKNGKWYPPSGWQTVTPTVPTPVTPVLPPAAPQTGLSGSLAERLRAALAVPEYPAGYQQIVTQDLATPPLEGPALPSLPAKPKVLPTTSAAGVALQQQPFLQDVAPTPLPMPTVGVALPPPPIVREVPKPVPIVIEPARTPTGPFPTVGGEVERMPYERLGPGESMLWTGLAEQAAAAREGKPVSLPAQAVASFQAGMGDVLASAGGAAKWLGVTGLGEQMVEAGAERRERFAVPAEPFTWKQLLNPQFYAVNVVRSIPFSLSFIPVALLAGYATGAAAAATTLGAFGKTLLSAVGAGTVSRALESALEAGSTYEEALRQGMTTEQADAAADQTFKGNLSLVGLDIAQMALWFSPLPAAGVVGKAVSGAQRLAGGGVSESVEEIVQEYVQKRALGSKETFGEMLKTPEMQEAGVIGLIHGTGFGGLGTAVQTINRVRDTVFNTLPSNAQGAAQETVRRLTAQGMSADEAKLAVLDKIAGTPDGQALVARIAQEVLGQVAATEGDIAPQTGVPAVLAPTPTVAPARPTMPPVAPTAAAPTIPQPVTPTVAPVATQPYTVGQALQSGTPIRLEVVAVEPTRVQVRQTVSDKGMPVPSDSPGASPYWIGRDRMQKWTPVAEGVVAAGVEPVQPVSGPQVQAVAPGQQPVAPSAAVAERAVAPTVRTGVPIAAEVRQMSEAEYIAQYEEYHRRMKLAEEKPQLITGIREANKQLEEANRDGKPRVAAQAKRTIDMFEKRLEANLQGRFVDEDNARGVILATAQAAYRKIFAAAPAGGAGVAAPIEDIGPRPQDAQVWNLTKAEYLADQAQGFSIGDKVTYDGNPYSVDFVHGDLITSYNMAAQEIIGKAGRELSNVLKLKAEDGKVIYVVPGLVQKVSSVDSPATLEARYVRLVTNRISGLERDVREGKVSLARARQIYSDIGMTMPAEVAPAVTPTTEVVAAPTEAVGITVTINEARDSVEVSFPTKPADDVILRLREAGFKWNRKDRLWFAKRSAETEAAAREIAGVAEPVAAADVAPPAPAAEKPSPTKALSNRLNSVRQAVKVIEQTAPLEAKRMSQARKKQIETAYATIGTHADKLGINAPRMGTFYSADAYLKVARKVTAALDAKYGAAVTEPVPVAPIAEVAPAEPPVAAPDPTRIERLLERAQELRDRAEAGLRPDTNIAEAKRLEDEVRRLEYVATQARIAKSGLMQPRAKLFVELFGEFNNLEYMEWINTMSGRFMKAQGITSGEILPNQQDAFTAFLREQVAQAKQPTAPAEQPAAPVVAERAVAEVAVTEPDIQIGDTIYDRSMPFVTGEVVGEGTLGGRKNWPAWKVRLSDGTISAMLKGDNITKLKPTAEAEAVPLPFEPSPEEALPGLEEAALEPSAGMLWQQLRGMTRQEIAESSEKDTLTRIYDALVEGLGDKADARSNQIALDVAAHSRLRPTQTLEQAVREVVVGGVEARVANVKQELSRLREITGEQTTAREFRKLTDALESLEAIQNTADKLLGEPPQYDYRGLREAAEQYYGAAQARKEASRVAAQAVQLEEYTPSKTLPTNPNMVLKYKGNYALLPATIGDKTYISDGFAIWEATEKQVQVHRERVARHQGVEGKDVSKPLEKMLKSYATSVTTPLGEPIGMGEIGRDNRPTVVFADGKGGYYVLDQKAYEYATRKKYVLQFDPENNKGPTIALDPDGKIAGVLQSFDMAKVDIREPGATVKLPEVPTPPYLDNFRIGERVTAPSIPEARPTLAATEQRLAEAVNVAIGDVVPPIGLGLKIEERPVTTGARFAFTDPELERVHQETHGVTPESTLEKTKAVIDEIYRKATREYEYLPKTVEFQELRFALNQLAKQKKVQAANTVESLRGVLADMQKNRAAYDLFERKVLLDDLREEAGRGHALPNNWTPEGVESEIARVEEAMQAHPEVQKALDARKELWNALKGEYIEKMAAVDFNVADRFTREYYFRHMVLEHAQGRAVTGTGARLRTPTGRGFLKQREGGNYLMNTNYLEADFEVMAQMRYDMQVAEVLALASSPTYNVAPELQAQAKAKSTDEKKVDWHDLAPKGYGFFQPREGNLFYMTSSISERLAQQIMQGTLEATGVKPEDIRTSLAMGGPRTEICVKQEIVDTLENIARTAASGRLARLGRQGIGAWKEWQLISPTRFIKYNVRNLSGDAEAVFIGNPSVFRKVPQALKELYAYIYGKKSPTGNLRDWLDMGGMQSTLQVAELQDINELEVFAEMLERKPENVALRAFKAYWRGARRMTDFREGILRYAAYLDYQQQQEGGKTPKNWGASDPDLVMALPDAKQRSFMLSNQLLGAYDEVSVLTQDLRRNLLPFFSWKEVNARRYIQLMKNATIDMTATEALGRKVTVGLKRTPFLALRVGTFLVKASALWGMLQAYNNLFYPEEERDLSKSIQRTPHIILGRDEDGKIRYFSRLGILDDFLNWFAPDSSMKAVQDWLNGRISAMDAAKKLVAGVPKGIANTFVQGMGPVKTVVEAAVGKSFFPDMFNPSSVRDKALFVARSVGLGDLYSYVAGLPQRPYEDVLASLSHYKDDPGQSAYWEMRDAVSAYQKEIGKASYYAGVFSPRSNALYNLKLSLRYGDKRAAEKYFTEYANLGGTWAGLATSLSNMHPLHGLNRLEQDEFMATLDAEGRRRLYQALLFFEDVLGGEKTKPK